MKSNLEPRISARISEEVKERLGIVAGQLGLSESDLARIAVCRFLPDVESGKIKITLADLQNTKQAA